jgi:hypothetical protein
VTAKLMYNSLYQGKSQSDIHAGIGALQGHIELRGEVAYTLEIRRGDTALCSTRTRAPCSAILCDSSASSQGFRWWIEIWKWRLRVQLWAARSWKDGSLF